MPESRDADVGGESQALAFSRCLAVSVCLCLGLSALGCRPNDRGADPQSPAEGAAPAEPSQTPDTSQDLEADAEEALAEMPDEWKELLAQAEAMSRDEQNRWCVTCHDDVNQELIASKHHEAEVSCVQCHGESREHARDENNEIKPDQLFARADVRRECGACHDCALSEDAWADPNVEGGKVCSDCHTAHQFARNTATQPEAADAGRP